MPLRELGDAQLKNKHKINTFNFWCITVRWMNLEYEGDLKSIPNAWLKEMMIFFFFNVLDDVFYSYKINKWHVTITKQASNFYKVKYNSKFLICKGPVSCL